MRVKARRTAARLHCRGGRDPFFAEAASKGKPAALPGGCAGAPREGAAKPITFRLEHTPGDAMKCRSDGVL